MWRSVTLVFLFAGYFFGIASALAEPKVTGIRLGGNQESTRFVIDINERINYSHLILSDPYRVVIDLPEVEFDLQNSSGEGRGLVSQFRFGLFRAGVSRVVLDLTEPAVIDRIFILPPGGNNGYRLVLDLKPTTREAFLAAMRSPVQRESHSVEQQVPEYRDNSANSGVRTIVIDPGHGGVDPGNLGIIGVPEKNIVLATARTIRDHLNKNPKYRVILTRDRDVYIPHRDRFNVARTNRADLFISLHADSFRQEGVRGATVYTLSETSSDAEAARIAARENRSDLIAGIDLRGEPDDLTSILIDLAQRETMNHSVRFARTMISEMEGHIQLRRNSHRFAGFIVLKAPDVASILLEMGYLTNRADANFMNSRDGQMKMARALERALDAYFEALPDQGF